MDEKKKGFSPFKGVIGIVQPKSEPLIKNVFKSGRKVRLKIRPPYFRLDIHFVEFPLMLNGTLQRRIKSMTDNSMAIRHSIIFSPRITLCNQWNS